MKPLEIVLAADEHTQREILRALQERFEHQCPTCAKLPKTADGVLVVPGMELYRVTGKEGCRCQYVVMMGACDSIEVHAGTFKIRRFRHWLRHGDELYSTREAAEQARTEAT